MANSNRTTGIGFWGALTLMLIAFKITGYVQWSWWWVLAPLWAPMALAFLIVCAVFVISMVLDWEGR